MSVLIEILWKKIFVIFFYSKFIFLEKERKNFLYNFEYININSKIWPISHMMKLLPPLPAAHMEQSLIPLNLNHNNCLQFFLLFLPHFLKKSYWFHPPFWQKSTKKIHFPLHILDLHHILFLFFLLKNFSFLLK